MTELTLRAPIRQRARRPWWRRRWLKRLTVWLHRWLSLALGLVLLLVTTSGAVLLYHPQLEHAAHAGAYSAASGTPTIELAMALTTAARERAGFEPAVAYRVGDVVVTESYDPERKVTVDGVTGRVLGDYDPGAGVVGTSLALLDNLHECLFSCEDFPLYASWLATETHIPGLGAVTWGELLLGGTGAMLMFLALSGTWLWWPGVTRWATSMRVRFRRGRYARDYDLHQVAGMVAVPLLALWAYTGMSFEWPSVTKAYYQVVPGEAAPGRELVSVASDAPDISPAAAVTSAQSLLGGARRPVAMDLPDRDDATSTFTVWFRDGIDPYRYADYSGDLGVAVDRHGGAAKVTSGGPGRNLAAVLQDDWNFTTHAGTMLNPWLRMVWFVLGLSPVLLAVTGISTWLYKRRTATARRTAATARALQRT